MGRQALVLVRGVDWYWYTRLNGNQTVVSTSTECVLVVTVVSCRWREAALAGVAPPVVLAATHMRALDHVEIDLLKQHAVDLPDPSTS